MAEFYLFCAERHAVWVRRNRGDVWPWTRNPILQCHHFCNVYRELDRGTAYFRAHVLALERSYSRAKWMEFVVWASYVYRLVNRLESFEKTGFPPRSTRGVQAYLIQCARIANDRTQSLFAAAHQTTHLTALGRFLRATLQLWDRFIQALATADTPEEVRNASKLIFCLRQLAKIATHSPHLVAFCCCFGMDFSLSLSVRNPPATFRLAPSPRSWGIYVVADSVRLGRIVVFPRVFHEHVRGTRSGCRR